MSSNLKWKFFERYSQPQKIEVLAESGAFMSLSASEQLREMVPRCAHRAAKSGLVHEPIRATLLRNQRRDNYFFAYSGS